MSLIPITQTQESDYPLDPYNDLVPPAHLPGLNEVRSDANLVRRRYFSLSIRDINNYHKDKLKKHINAIRDQPFCFFAIPEFLPGFPIFNMTHCTCFLLRKLRQNGYRAEYMPPNLLYINWPINQQYMAITPPLPAAMPALPPPPPPPQQEKDVHYVHIGHRERVAEEVNRMGQPTSSSQKGQSDRANAFALQEEERFLYG
jgi:hypothetical protein